MTRTIGRRGLIRAVLAGAALSTAAAPPDRPTPSGRPSPVGARPATTRPLLIGTYTGAGGGQGIRTGTYDPATGRISLTATVVGIEHPSYLAVHPCGATAYAVSEREEGAVTAVALGADGVHRVLGSRPTGGAGPTHLSVHPGGRWLFSANYNSGSVSVHPIRGDGSLGRRSDLVAHLSPPPGPGQEGPHAHQIITAPDGRHVLATDLGNDTVYTYRLDTAHGTLAEVSRATVRPGAGPRHLTFHPGGRFAYLACELDDTVVVCGYDPATGTLSPGAGQSTGTGPDTSYPAQLLVTADGAFAYLANRGHNSLTRYAVEEDGAALRLLGTVPVGGDFPRQIALTPDGALLLAANQRSGTVTAFHVDRQDGGLRPAGAAVDVPGAACVLPL
ncbi:lactonase family protein [Streptomyces fulvorobeus]|uniref:6-phosphogluconolactonase (Cycloisomerase 2 family) n=1 Tax=Streptomyces fulvorobeus TaxID=284028 RepID=A0A7J0CE32_9ACTN|nr:lactonase family protein [Streptomyces fulvorobeus]NYE43672.1 6-phosphogluconolactonase (cycloisomerase 2 family) [Streptomyces fulvorobeus]GFN00154.1 hypothetical protein Sfulv_49640 [Streptomyces fulvorobeus]